MIVFHRTDAADTILDGGFRDGEGRYLTKRVWRGVWVSDLPLSANEGAFGDDLVALEMPALVLETFEWVEEGKGYREFLVPARILNLYDRRVAVECEDCAFAAVPPAACGRCGWRP